ncbi:putative quinol monooxygenase [Microbacterium sp. PM5]|uniref:putative quinol monooxygenase n=1 Tax=Microbacterium sp. PM5 TaxID=2014534 RepID=UPI000DD163FF|nr:putative quinol monooxygenase [Microbacterium sp. PM5]AXA97113.1 antibiotic biosynthesis monooxygenase [Microbacterium sp. PM5]
MTVVVTAVFQPVEGQRPALIEALSAAMPAVHAEEGCLLYAIHAASDGTVVMIEKWAEPTALAAHAQGDAVKALQAAVTGLVTGPAEVVTMTPVPAGTPSQGAL